MNPGATQLQTQGFQANFDYTLELQQEVIPLQQHQPLRIFRKENIPSSGTAITGDWTNVQKEGEDMASYPLPSQTTGVSKYLQTLIRSWMVNPQMTKEMAQYLTGAAKELYEKLLSIVRRRGIHSGLRAKGIRVHRFLDPEEGDSELVLEVHVEANAAQALAYWEAVGEDIDKWKEKLDIPLRERLIHEWSLRVLW